MELRRSGVVVFFLCCVPVTFAQSIAGLQGGSYAIGTSGDQITSLSNDDGSVIHVHHDSAGTETGMTVSPSPQHAPSLSLQYAVSADGSGWLQAGSLPMLRYTSDMYGRTTSAVLDPGMSVVDGQWYIDVNAPDPIVVASFSYRPGGQLSEVALDSGLSLQLGPPADGVVAQSLIRPNGTVAATALPVVGDDVNVVPAQLDAIAARFGLIDWAETLTFSMAASGHLTTGRDASGLVQLYLVDAGPFRVGYAPDGTALFYDLMPTYTTGEFSNDPATHVAGVAPSHIVMTAEGAAGLYTDRPAYGAIYSAWTGANASGVTDTYFATIEPAASSSLRVATEGHSRRRFRVKSEVIIRQKTTVCVEDYCWTREYVMWVPDPIVFSGGSPSSGGSGPPAAGGSRPLKPGNQYTGNSKIFALIGRGLDKAKTKLESETCKALLQRTGVDNRKLIDVMTARGYQDPAKYLTNDLSYVTGNTKDCVDSPVASTTVYSRRVAICAPFGNATTGMAAVYLIHEMMHALGYGESPQYAGFPTSSQISDQVAVACGRY